MSNELTINAEPEAGLGAPDSDETAIRLFLHGRCRNTQSSYGHDIRHFRQTVATPLPKVSLAQLQNYADTLDQLGLSGSSRNRKLSAIKSLLRFAHQMGYTPFDAGRPLRLPKYRDRISERILTEGDVLRMISLESDDRNRAILIALYGLGCRVSELCGLTVGDCRPRGDGTGNVTLFTKGSKTNVVFAPAQLWSVLERQLSDRGADVPLFVGRKGTGLRRETVTRIVAHAARRVGMTKNVSAHWLRHAHASHAIDRGAPLSLVTAQLSDSSAAVTSRYLHARTNDSSARFLPI
jgi:integrase/recombinase XerD